MILILSSSYFQKENHLHGSAYIYGDGTGNGDG
jgi:hypothetical protein